MAKFDNAKVGDKVFSTVYGWGKVFSVDKTDVHFPLVIEFDKNIRMCYRSDGTTNVLNKFPNLFWNEVKLPNEEEDKKPFDLVEFLRENLEPKEFLLEEHNNTINYSHRDGRFFYNYTIYLDRITEIYFKNSKYEIVEVVQVLNENNITPQQLKQAYKILNWF